MKKVINFSILLAVTILSSISFGSELYSSKLEFRESASFESDFVANIGDFPSVHSATLVELPNKKLMSCWYAGSNEGASDVQIYCRSQSLTDRKWQNTVVAVARKEFVKGNYKRNSTIGNPVLYFNSVDRLIYLFYVVRTFGGWSLSEVAYKTSADYGKTWGDGRILETRLERRFGGKLTRSLPFEISPGKILLPLYYEGLAINKKDRTAGYTCELELSFGLINKKRCFDIPGGEHLQPALVKVKNTLFAYLRSANSVTQQIEMAQLDLTEGYSDLVEWKKRTNLNIPNPGSSVATGKTKDDKILLVYNSAGGRNVLNLAISKDGYNFIEIAKIEGSEGLNPSAEYSYPTLLTDSNGLYHLVYTHWRTAIKHVTFNEEWINSKLNNL